MVYLSRLVLFRETIFKTNNYSYNIKTFITMKYSQIKPIIEYWHNLDYSMKYWASTNAVGIPPMWLSKCDEVVKCLEFLKANSIYKYN